MTSAAREDGVAGECVSFIGLPASGKTTFYRQRFAATHRHVSKDLWPKTTNKEARQTRELRDALSRGERVVVDNTNPAVSDRAPIIAMAREFGARTIGYHFTATTRDAVGRNRGRQPPARVPDVAIFASAKRMVAPTRDEGFDDLYRVAIAHDGAFEVERVP
jgi:predicted kinase